MKPTSRLIAIVSLCLLTACAASPPSGAPAGVRLSDPPPELLAPVADPVPLPAAP